MQCAFWEREAGADDETDVELWREVMHRAFPAKGRRALGAYDEGAAKAALQPVDHGGLLPASVDPTERGSDPADSTRSTFPAVARGKNVVDKGKR